MSAISQKSITGITSITTPAGVDNQLTLHNNNTTEAVKLDTAGNLHFHNHLNITGVSTASNFKTGTSNLHNTGLNVQDLDVDGHTNLDNVNIAGVTTFSSNTIVTDGSSYSITQGSSGVFAIAASEPRIRLIDNESNPNYSIYNTSGVFRIHDETSNVNRLTISSSGNVSITNDIDVDGHTNLDNVSISGISSTGNIYITTGGDGRKLSFAGDGSSHYIKMDHTLNGPIINGYGGIAFETNGTNERLRIASDGKVGINTDDARFNNASNIASASFYHNDPKFGVHGSMVIGNLSGTATDERQLAFYRRGGPAPGTPMSTHKMGRIAWYGSSNDTSLPDLAGFIECVPNGGGWTAGSNRRGSITFNNHEKETVRINSAGYVGIGTENPQRPLAVTNGTSGVTAEFNVPDNAPTGSAGLSLNIVNRSNSGYAPLSFNSTVTTFGNSGVEKARLDNNGNWCVGITGGSAKLHTKGEQSGGLIKCDAAEGTSRFFVTGNDTNACEVNLYDGAGSQKGILKAESDGMSLKSAGTPSQLQFFTTVTGGSSTRRLLIDDYGATQIERGSNGWSTLYHKTNNGGTRYHYRQASTGSSGTTINLIRIRRHYWGSGNYKISTRQTYYNGSFESVHFISGHAANGNTSAFSINYVNVNGGNSSQIQKTATSHSSPGNNYAGWIDVYISIGAYEYYDVIIEASAMAQYSQDINSLANDGYALHPV